MRKWYHGSSRTLFVIIRPWRTARRAACRKSPPFGVLEVSFAGDEGDLDIGEGRAGQHAPVLFLLQVGEDQPLPVAGQHFLAAVGVVLDAAAGGRGSSFKWTSA